MAVALWVNKEIEVKKGKRGEKRSIVERKNWYYQHEKGYNITKKERRGETREGGGGVKRNIKELHAENIVKKKN